MLASRRPAIKSLQMQSARHNSCLNRMQSHLPTRALQPGRRLKMCVSQCNTKCRFYAPSIQMNQQYAQNVGQMQRMMAPSQAALVQRSMLTRVAYPGQRKFGASACATLCGANTQPIAAKMRHFCSRDSR